MSIRPALLVPLLLCAGLTLDAWAQAVPAPAPASAAQATTPAGAVKRAVGAVTLERAGQTRSVQPGMVVMVGDTLRTGADGAAGITLSDDTRLTAGPGSELVISAFGFDTTTQDGNLLVSLWRGTLNVVTGLIGKKSPEKVNVQTRTVVLGVRGTEFIVDAAGVAR